MKRSGILRVPLVALLLANSLALAAKPRQAEWNKVEEATAKDQPQTAISLLKPIESAAFAANAWAEGTKALAMRIALEARINGGPGAAVKQVAAETATAPPEARPILRLLHARWLQLYYRDHCSELSTRSATNADRGADFRTWDLSRMLAEIDLRFQEALADKTTLQKIPVARFNGLLVRGVVGDGLRPTLYDFIAHAAMEFYSLEEFAASKPQDDFEIDANSPALDSSDAFLAWHPQAPDPTSPKLRAIQLYQDLLGFHQADADSTAFLHCDLERLRWAGKVAVGPTKPARLDAALRAFIAAHPKHLLSADARNDVAVALVNAKRNKEAYKFARTGAHAFPRHPFGKLCKSLVTDLEAKSIKLDTETLWTPAGAEMTLKHANIAHVWFRAYHCDWAPDEMALTGDPVPANGTAREALLNQEPALAWDEPLRNDKDYLEHSTTLTAPEHLVPGYYIIVASAREDFSIMEKCMSFFPVHVTQLAMVVRRNRANCDGFVTDPVTGAPRGGVDVSLWHARKEVSGLTTESTKTDADGWFSLSLTGQGEDFLFVAGSKDDVAIVRTHAANSSYDDNAKTKGNVVLFIDRPIYRPGQTVYFKGIYCESNRNNGTYQTVPGKHATVALRNPNNKEIQKLDVLTNEHGSFSGTFSLPPAGLLGYFNISVGDMGSTGFRVEEYKRPKFFAELKPPVAAAALGAQVTLMGKAEAFTGAAVDGAKVTWRVSRDTNWPDWIERCEWGAHPWSAPKAIANGTAMTAADGSFSIYFTAESDLAIDPKFEPAFSFEVTADVTDSSGETRSATYRVNIAYTTLKARISTDVWQEEAKPVVFNVLTQSHDDEGRPATGTLRIYQLKQPQRCPRAHPGRKYATEEDDAPDPAAPVHWQLGALMKEIPVQTAQADTDHAGRAEVSSSLPAGIYRAVFVAKDANGRTVQAIEGFQVVKPSADMFPTKIPFFAAVSRATLEPGQPFTLLWGSGHPSARACVEFFKDDVLLKREWSAPDRTQQSFAFIPDESMRGGVTVVVTQTTMNRLNEFSKTIEIPWSNKDLKLRWEHFTSKLNPGMQDTWTAMVSTPQGEAVATEMVATLYDASLDVFALREFQNFNSLFRNSSKYSASDFSTIGFRAQPVSSGTRDAWGKSYGNSLFQPYRSFIWEVTYIASPIKVGFSDAFAADPFCASPRAESPATIPPRKNLQETAFFYPHLTSDEKGEVRITFTMPEALTKWKFLGFAHDNDMRSGMLEGETISAKDLMVQPNPPRFLREGDVLDFTVKITNPSDKAQAGTARLTFSDAATQKDATAALGIAAPDQPWSIPAKESRTLAWRLTVPDGSGFLTYKAVATSGRLSDGEEGWLPVIPRRVMLTESMALPIRDAGTKDFHFQKLLDSGKSASLENRLMQVQVVSQPAWYAVMALPYLMEFPHECAEQTFNRYYANALARHIAESNPKIRRIFDLWKNTPALDSPLARNAELKGGLLEETPWLNEANDQSQACRKLGLLFDDNQLGEQLEGTQKKLADMQNSDGLWPWFPGGHSNEYISLYIATGFARLRALGVETDVTPALKALPNLDASLTEQLDAIKKAAEKEPKILTANHLDSVIAHHLYTRTFFLKDAAVKRADKEAFDYFTAQAKNYWPSLNSRMSRAHVALALARLGDLHTARLITRSLREHAVSNEETGMSWQDAGGEYGWFWWQAPIETQAMMIEAFREIDHDDRAVEACQVWLIKQMQARDWRTTKATADAIHALLMGGKDLLGSDALLQVSLGGTPVKPEGVEPGTGFSEARFAGSSIKPEMGAIQLTKTDPGVAWASVHWQYLEDVSKVTEHNATPLKLEKSLFVRHNLPQGPKLEPVTGPVKVGDELVTRLVLRNDRAMEFVHLKDLRGSGTEPLNVLSGYRWQDGFGYYEVTRDTASHFFIDTLPAGTHVFETRMRVQHAGVYQTGFAQIQCMYAPEFSAHSASVRLEVVR